MRAGFQVCRNVLLASALLVWLSLSARASVQLKFIELDPQAGLSGFRLHNGSLPEITVNAGMLRFDTNGDDANPPPLTFISGTDDIWTFCIELGQFAIKEHNTYEKTAVADAPDPQVTSSLSGAKINTARANLLDLLADNYWAIATTGTLSSDVIEAVAFQLAVWEIVHEGTSAAPGNPLPGSYALSLVNLFPNIPDTFYVSNYSSLSTAGKAAVDLANSWLSDLHTKSHDNTLSLHALTNRYKQDQIYQYIDTDTNELIPEPTSMLVWAGIGLSGLGLVTQRRRAW